MAVNVVRGKSKRSAPVAPAPLPIGEIEGTIFNCPNCGRPLAPGARRCQGCGTRLLIGVPLAKVSVFVSVGVAIGLALAGTVAGAAGALTKPSGGVPPPGPVASASAAPSARAPTPRPTSNVSGVPAMVRSALGQAVTLNARLAATGESLEPLLASSRLNVSAVERELRSLAADAAYGASLPARMAGWDDAAPVAAELVAFYAEVREVARDGLRYSIANRSAYRAAGQSMVRLLGDLPGLDARTRAVAQAAGADLPPSTYGP